MRLGTVTLLLIALLVAPTLAFAGVSGTSTVDFGTGEFQGYWCYTIEFTWDAPMDLSNVSVFVGLEGLACACDPDIFRFDTPAGTSTGTGEFGICTLDYIGTYICAGDASLPPEYADAAALRWDPSPEVCDAGTSGSGTMVFYSLLAPGEAGVHPNALSFKSGLTTYLGDVTGTLPAADCGVHGEHQSLGSVKARYED